MLHQPAGQPAQGAVVTQVHLSPATSQALGLMDGVTTLISPSVHRRRSAGARGIQCDSFLVRSIQSLPATLRPSGIQEIDVGWGSATMLSVVKGRGWKTHTIIGYDPWQISESFMETDSQNGLVSKLARSWGVRRTKK